MSSGEQVRGLYSAVAAVSKDQLKDIHTAQVCYVTKYHGIEARTCDVVIPITEYTENEDGSYSEEPWDPIPNVPTYFPGGADSLIDWEIKEGTPGLLVFVERNFARWFLSDGKEVTTPDLEEMLGASSPILFTRLSPKRSIGEIKTRIHLRDNGEVEITSTALKVKADAVRLGAFDAATPLAKADTTNQNIGLVQAKVDALAAILGIPPLGALPSVASSKVFSNG